MAPSSFSWSEPAGSPDESPPGQIYEEAHEEDYRAFSTGRAMTTPPLTDRWGTWVSASVPLTDPRSGKVLAVFGMDVDAGQWRGLVARQLLVPILFTLALALIAMAGAALLRWRNRLAAPRQNGLLPRYAEAVLTAAVGLAITLLLVWVAHDREDRARRDAFSRLAVAHTANVTETLRDIRGNQLEGLARFFAASLHVNRQEFQSFAGYLTDDAAVQGWGWIPAVTAKDRARLENGARRDGLAGFVIWELDAQGQRTPAAARETYYPVFYAEPLAGNEVALGFDLGSEPIRRTALEEAARTGLVTATDPVTLVQEPGTQKGVLVFRAVFADDAKTRLEGFALTALRLETMLRHPFRLAGDDDLAVILDLYQLQTGAPPVFLASTLSEEARTHPVQWELRRRFATDFSVVTPLFVWGKAYAVVAHPGSGFSALHPVRQGWLIASAGLIFTTLLAAFIGFLSNRRSVLEQQVAERTTKLQESEARFRNLFEHSPVAYQSLDESGCYLDLNSELCDLLGYSREELLGRSFADVWRPETRHLFLEKFAHFKNCGHIEPELELVRQDGTPVTVLLVGRIQRAANGNFIRTHCILHNITERKQAEQEIKLNEGRLASLLRISHYNPASIQDLFEYALDEAITLTASRIGYILLYDEATQEFSMNTWSKEVMKECRLERSITFKLAHAGLWGEVVRRGSPIIINDFQAAPNPWKKGYPEGHVRIEKFLSVPVFSDNRIVMVVAVGNKETDYSITDIRQLTLMVDGVWRIIERKRMEEELRRYRDDLERLVEERTTELRRVNRQLQEEFSERLRTEMALRESEEKLAAIIDSITDHISMLDEEHNIVWANEVANRLFGSDIIGKKCYSAYHGRNSVCESCIVSKTFADGQAHEHQTEVIGQDGKKKNFWCISNVAARYEDGRPKLVVEISRDITERKRAEEALRESEARFRAIFEGAPVGIGLWDLEGRFLEGNPAMTAMLGYSLEELRHLDPTEITPPEDLAMHQALFQEVLRGRREFFEGEGRCRRQDGSFIWVWVHISPIRSASGEILFALIMLKDITQEKQVEAELSAYQQRLRSLASELSLTEERERRRVAADLHDHIGQVLALTQIKLGALRQGASSSVDMAAVAEIREYIGEAIRYTRSLTFELGLPVLYDLGLEAAVEWLADRFQEEHGLEIHVRLDGLPKPLSEAAKVLVFRVLRELLANVVKHAQASRVDISVIRIGEFISLAVKDNGIGFDPAEAGARMSRPDAFGLFSIRERLNHLGGYLEISSAPGRGASAYIRVPLEKTPVHYQNIV